MNINIVYNVQCCILHVTWFMNYLLNCYPDLYIYNTGHIFIEYSIPSLMLNQCSKIPQLNRQCDIQYALTNLRISFALKMWYYLQWLVMKLKPATTLQQWYLVFSSFLYNAVVILHKIIPRYLSFCTYLRDQFHRVTSLFVLIAIISGFCLLILSSSAVQKQSLEQTKGCSMVGIWAVSTILLINNSACITNSAALLQLSSLVCTVC